MERAAQERIDRYIYQVSRSLTRKNRADIEREIRGLVGDMLDGRCGGAPPRLADVDALLLELGDPHELAAKYVGNSRYLIGPALFPRYLSVLKLFAVIVGAALALSAFIRLIVSMAQGTPAFPFNWFGQTVGLIVSGLTGVFACVTVIFAIIESRGDSRFAEAVGRGMESFEEGITEVQMEFDRKARHMQNVRKTETFLDQLPPVPTKEAVISYGDPLASIVFTVLFGTLLLFSPQIFAAWLSFEGEVRSVSIFNMDVLRQLRGPIITIFALSILRELVRLIAGRHSIRTALATLACNLPALLLTLFVVTRDGLFNADFSSTITGYYPDIADFSVVFHYAGIVLICVIIFANLIEIATALYKGIKYN